MLMGHPVHIQVKLGISSTGCSPHVDFEKRSMFSVSLDLKGAKKIHPPWRSVSGTIMLPAKTFKELTLGQLKICSRL